MRFSTALTLIAGAASAAAQIAIPSSVAGVPISQQCQAAVLQVVTNSTLGQCFPAATLLPLLSSNTSIVPILDGFMSSLCYNQPCSNATLAAAAETITTGCNSTLVAAKLPANIVSTVFSVYPTMRETLCLKTTAPYTAASYGGVLGPAPIPSNSTAYNQTNGVFCVTSVLTQYSAYLSANVTIASIITALNGTNSVLVNKVKATNANIVCNECIFAAVDTIEAAYPIVGRIPLATALAYAKVNLADKNVTLNSFMNSTCAYKPLAVNTTVYPSNISVSIVNSTFTPRLATAPVS